MKNFIPFKKGSQSQGQPLDSSRACRKKAKLNLACLLISASFLLSPLKEATILITDIAGKQITSQSIKDNDGTPYTFSLGNIASGVYLVKVMSGETSYVVKLIKR